MRILMLSWRLPDNPQAGGAETLTFEILKRAVADGHDVTWFAAASEGQPDSEVRDGIRFVRRGRQWTVHFQAWLWLRRRKAAFDIVIDQINTLPFLTPLYLPRTQRRMFIHQTAREYWWHQPRGLFRLIAPFGYAAEPQYLKAYRSTRTITVSDSTRAELIALGLPADEVVVIPEAITTPSLAALEPKTGPLRVIVIGRVTPAKFIEEALAAFVLVHERVGDSVLDIVGSGDPEYVEKLKSEVSAAGLSNAVTFHGRVSEDRKSELLAQAHVHVFASHREGWGLTVTEAAAMGTPTVGYDAPGVRDSVRDARMLCPIDDGPAGLAERVQLLHTNAELYAEIREETWRFANSLSYEATTEAFMEALNA